MRYWNLYYWEMVGFFVSGFLRVFLLNSLFIGDIFNGVHLED